MQLQLSLDARLRILVCITIWPSLNFAETKACNWITISRKKVPKEYMMSPQKKIGLFLFLTLAFSSFSYIPILRAGTIGVQGGLFVFTMM